MSTDPQPRPLRDRPNLRHLKAQAKDLFKAGEAKSITDAQFQIARLYGFASWPKLKAHLESLEEAGQLKLAIDSNDIDRVKRKWLLDHGANPNCDNLKRKYRETALDYVIGTYGRSPERLSECIDILLAVGGTTRYNAPGVLEVLCQQRDRLAEQLDTDPQLAHRRFPELDCGSTGVRRLLLTGASLLHVAAEFGISEAAALLLDRGADVNARATVDDAGIGGQTAIFHAVTQFDDAGLPMARLLVERGADLSVRVKLPGHYEQPDEVVECTPLGYALRFQTESQPRGRTTAFLRERGAIE